MQQVKVVLEYAKLGRIVGFKLAGSANTIYWALQGEGFTPDEIADIENNVLFTEALDETALCCDICGWWCATEEVSDNFDELVCDQCMKEGQGEEE
jgi:hypothetical protein